MPLPRKGVVSNLARGATEFTVLTRSLKSVRKFMPLSSKGPKSVVRRQKMHAESQNYGLQITALTVEGLTSRAQ